MGTAPRSFLSVDGWITKKEQGFMAGPNRLTRRDLALSALATAALAGSAPWARAYELDGTRKILVWGGRTPVTNLDPHQRFDSPSYLMQSCLYDPLVRYRGSPAEIVPWLAAHWESSPDARIWTFHLAPQATFANGDPVDAASVQYSFARALKINKAVSWMLHDALDPDGIVAVDSTTVRFTLQQPYPSFLGFLPWWFVVNPRQIAAHEAAGDLGQAWMMQNTAGSGPFRIARWQQDTLYLLQARADYWNGWPQGEQHRPGGVFYRIIREPSAQRTALVTRQADIVEGLTTADYVQVRGVPTITVGDNIGSTVFGIKFNCKVGPTADVNLRRAIAAAFDYDALPELYAGDARLLTSPFPDIVRGHIDVPDFPRQNLERARAFLAKTQWAAGGLELDYVHQLGNDETRRVGLLLLNSLQPLNIKVNVKPTLWANMVANAQTPETVANMTGLFTVTYSTDPDSAAYQYHRHAWGQWFGVSHYDDPELFALIEKARSLPQWSDRAPLYADIQKRIADGQPEVFGYVPNTRIAYRSDVKGYDYTPMAPTGFADFHAMWIEG
jgi:peptide/nickel transport system substrate-binding protein